MGLSLDATPLLERLCDAISRRRRRDREICEVALDRIRAERSNFEHIVAGRPYSRDPLHKKAVTQYSFESLDKAIRQLSHVRKFRRAAQQLAGLCKQELARPSNQRGAAEVIAVINELEPRLARYVDRM